MKFLTSLLGIITNNVILLLGVIISMNAQIVVSAAMPRIVHKQQGKVVNNGVPKPVITSFHEKMSDSSVNGKTTTVGSEVPIGSNKAWNHHLHIMSTLIPTLSHHQPNITEEDQRKGHQNVCEEVKMTLRMLRSLMTSISHSSKTVLNPIEFTLTLFTFVPFLSGNDPMAQTQAWLSFSCYDSMSSDKDRERDRTPWELINELNAEVIPVSLDELEVTYDFNGNLDFVQPLVSASLRHASTKMVDFDSQRDRDLFLWTHPRMLYFVDFWDQLQDYLTLPAIIAPAGNDQSTFSSIRTSNPLNKLYDNTNPFIFMPSQDEIFCHSQFWLMNSIGFNTLQKTFRQFKTFDIHSFQILSLQGKKSLLKKMTLINVELLENLLVSYLPDSICIRSDSYVQPLIEEEHRLHFYSVSLDTPVEIKFLPSSDPIMMVTSAEEGDGDTRSGAEVMTTCDFEIDYGSDQLLSWVKSKTIVFPFTVSMNRSMSYYSDPNQWCQEINYTSQLMQRMAINEQEMSTVD
jgi:hypothetical protein